MGILRTQIVQSERFFLFLFFVFLFFVFCLFVFLKKKKKKKEKNHVAVHTEMDNKTDVNNNE